MMLHEIWKGGSSLILTRIASLGSGPRERERGHLFDISVVGWSVRGASL